MKRKEGKFFKKGLDTTLAKQPDEAEQVFGAALDS
jgi:hypothetical protein